MAGERNGEGGGRRGLRLATGTARRVAEEQERAKRTERMRLEEERMPAAATEGNTARTSLVARGAADGRAATRRAWRRRPGESIHVRYCCVDGASRSAMEKGNDAELRSAARTKKLNGSRNKQNNYVSRGGDRETERGRRAGGRHRAALDECAAGAGQPNKHRRGRQRLNQRWGMGMGGGQRGLRRTTRRQRLDAGDTEALRR